jgi:hypothetical protein
MNGLHSTFRFADGRLVKTVPPQWFVNATANSENWEERFTAAGATKIAEFGSADGLEIYQAPDGSYFILYWELQNCIAEIFVDNIADYVLFRATYVAPLASLIGASVPDQASSGSSRM